MDGNWHWTACDQIPMVHYTRKGTVLYAICLAWPGKSLTLEAPTPTRETRVRMVGVGPVSWEPPGQGLTVDLPAISVAGLPCRHAWVFEITELQDAR